MKIGESFGSWNKKAMQPIDLYINEMEARVGIEPA